MLVELRVYGSKSSPSFFFDGLDEGVITTAEGVGEAEEKRDEICDALNNAGASGSGGNDGWSECEFG
jgi:hypothetical protein